MKIKDLNNRYIKKNSFMIDDVLDYIKDKQKDRKKQKEIKKI